MADTNRKINIWINDVQVENTFKSINNALRQSRNELANMTIGSKEYIEQTKKIKELNAHLENHKRLQGQLSSGWKDIIKIGIGNFLSNMATRGVDLVTNAFKNAYNIIKEFASGVSELKAITGASGYDLDFLKKKAVDLGAEYGRSAKEIVTAMKLVGSAKPELLSNVQALSDVTEAVLTLSQASKMDLEKSTKSLTTIMNQFSHSSSLAEDDINILAAGAKYGAVEIDYLSEAISKSGTSMKSAGLNLEQGTAIMELFGEKGIDASTAGTGFRQILIRLQGDTKNYTNGVFDLNKALDNNAKIGGNNVELANKFGKEYYNLAQILIQNKDRFNELTQQVTGTNVAFEQAADQMNNLSGDLDKAGGSWDRFILSIESGDGIISKTIRTAIQGFTELVNVLARLNDGESFRLIKLKKDSDFEGQFTNMVQKHKDELGKLNSEQEKDLYLKGQISNYQVRMRGVEYTLRTEIENGNKISKDRRAELEMTRDMYTKVIDELKKYKQKNEDVNKTYDGELKALKKLLADKLITQEEYQKRLDALNKKYNRVTTFTPDKGADKENQKRLKEMEKYQKAYNDLREQLSKLNLKYNLEDLSEEERAIKEVELKYKDQLDVVDKFIQELETKQATKKGINAQELDFLNKFYQQKKNLMASQVLEEDAIENKFAAKRLEEKKKIEQQIFDLTASASEKEQAETLKKYEDLITAAKSYGIDTYNLEEKLIQEMDDLKNTIFGEKTDIFGMTQEDWDKFYKNFDKAMKYVDAARNMVSSYFEFQTAKENAQVADYEYNTNKKKDALKEQLDSGLIDQKNYDTQIAALDKKLDNDKKKIEIEQAIRNRNMKRFDVVLNTASAIMNALTVQPLVPLGLILAAAATASGALQLAAINKEPIPKLASGARINKRTLAEIGEAGPEIVLSNSIVSDPSLGPIADDLARIQEGKKPNFLGQPNAPNYSGMQKAIGGNNTNSNITTTTTYINQVDNKSIDSMKNEISEMKSFIKEQTEEFKKLKYLQAIITNDQLNDNQQDEKLRKRYSGI